MMEFRVSPFQYNLIETWHKDARLYVAVRQLAEIDRDGERVPGTREIIANSIKQGNPQPYSGAIGGDLRYEFCSKGLTVTYVGTNNCSLFVGPVVTEGEVSFVLTEDQAQKAQETLGMLDRPSIVFKFTATSIGCIVRVSDTDSGTTVDVSDYEDW
jgi:hypothetical protein